MINYSPLPSRVRRIIKVYDYCIQNIINTEEGIYSIALKDGYQSGSGFPSIVINVKEMETAIYQFKSVVRPSSREIKTALYGFTCPVCSGQIKKGANYADLGGLKICMYCNVQD